MCKRQISLLIIILLAVIKFSLSFVFLLFYVFFHALLSFIDFFLFWISFVSQGYFRTDNVLCLLRCYFLIFRRFVYFLQGRDWFLEKIFLKILHFAHFWFAFFFPWFLKVSTIFSFEIKIYFAHWFILQFTMLEANVHLHCVGLPWMTHTIGWNHGICFEPSEPCLASISVYHASWNFGVHNKATNKHGKLNHWFCALKYISELFSW